MAIVAALCGLYPLSKPAKSPIHVSFEENDSVWMTSPGNAQALAERVAFLGQANVFVALPDRPDS